MYLHVCVKSDYFFMIPIKFNGNTCILDALYLKKKYGRVAIFLHILIG